MLLPLNSITALSPLDGRYARHTQTLNEYLSEFGLIKMRLTVEIRFLQALSQHIEIPEVPEFSTSANQFLDNIINQFDIHDAEKIKTIEKTTNHDVKAVEYFLKAKLSEHQELNVIKEFVHFACTSEDINNLSYGLMVKAALANGFMGDYESVLHTIENFAKQYAKVPLLSRTHGQTASPTTLGKEFKNVAARLRRQFSQLKDMPILGKLNGAVGNFNAHHIAYPNIDWVLFSQNFVESLGLSWNPYTTQIEPHDNLAEIFDNLARLNTILIDFARDMWGYISLGYFTQKVIEGEVGSSTMPHKVNPIDYENAEGNLGMANAILNHLSAKLPISRWQRDLTDSTVLRNIGVGFGYTLIALKSLQKGLSKIEVNEAKLADDLNNNWEILGEAIQTVMRRYAVPEAYEKLKAFTRGKRINQETLAIFIDSLEIPDTEKARLKHLTPANYIGLAEKLALL